MFYNSINTIYIEIFKHSNPTMVKPNARVRKALLEIVRAGLDRNLATRDLKSPVQVRNINPAAFEGMKQGTLRDNLAKAREQCAETNCKFQIFFSIPFTN